MTLYLGAFVMEDFFASDMERVTGVKRTRWQQWRDRHWVYKPSVQVAEGHGTRNIWNHLDLYDITLFRKILEMGLPRKWAAEIAKTFGSLGGYPELRLLPFPDDEPIEVRDGLSRIEQQNRETCWQTFKYLLYFRREDRDEGLISLLPTGKIDLEQILSRPFILYPENWGEMSMEEAMASAKVKTHKEGFGDFDFLHIIDLQRIRKEVDAKIEKMKV